MSLPWDEDNFELLRPIVSSCILFLSDAGYKFTWWFPQLQTKNVPVGTGRLQRSRRVGIPPCGETESLTTEVSECMSIGTPLGDADIIPTNKRCTMICMYHWKSNVHFHTDFHSCKCQLRSPWNCTDVNWWPDCEHLLCMGSVSCAVYSNVQKLELRKDRRTDGNTISTNYI